MHYPVPRHLLYIGPDALMHQRMDTFCQLPDRPVFGAGVVGAVFRDTATITASVS